VNSSVFEAQAGYFTSRRDATWLQRCPHSLPRPRESNSVATSSDDDPANLAGLHLAASSSKLSWNTNQHLMHHALSCTRDWWHWVTDCRYYFFPRSVV